MDTARRTQEIHAAPQVAHGDPNSRLAVEPQILNCVALLQHVGHHLRKRAHAVQGEINEFRVRLHDPGRVGVVFGVDRGEPLHDVGIQSVGCVPVEALDERIPCVVSRRAAAYQANGTLEQHTDPVAGAR